MTTAEMLRREGETRGKVEGKREMLLFLLRQRFGRIPAATAARVEKATADELNVWSSRVLAASSLSDVLADVAVTVPPNEAMQPAVRARRATRRG